jgi:hypothetical protein
MRRGPCREGSPIGIKDITPHESSSIVQTVAEVAELGAEAGGTVSGPGPRRGRQHPVGENGLSRAG